MTIETALCPNCESNARVLRDKPWLSAVCVSCGATVEVGRASNA